MSLPSYGTALTLRSGGIDHPNLAVLGADLQVKGSLTITGDDSLPSLTVAGDSSLQGSLTVDGDFSLNNLTVDGDCSLNNLTVDGDCSLNNLTVDGDCSLQGSLTVTGTDTSEKIIVNSDMDIAESKVLTVFFNLSDLIQENMRVKFSFPGGNLNE